MILVQVSMMWDGTSTMWERLSYHVGYCALKVSLLFGRCTHLHTDFRVATVLKEDLARI